MNRLALVMLLAAPLAQAQDPIGYASVAAAQKALEAKDGDGTVVTHPEGWVVINEPAAAAQWSFVPSGHEAFPAVVRRTIKRDGKDVSVQTALLCEAKDRAACDKLRAEFEGMNDRIVQAVKARGRGTPPPMLPGR